MRLPEAKIKQAILHPEEEVRLTAVSYFADLRSSDPEVMPLVIEAIEKYGRDTSFRILRDAERLVQTPPTLDWLMNELRRDFDITKINDDNIRFAIALVILAAPVELLARRKADIDALPSFPDELRRPLDERLRMATWTLNQGWEALKELGRAAVRKGDFTTNDVRHAGQIIESMRRHAITAGPLVMALLHGHFPKEDADVLRYLEPQIIELAGEMRLQAAIPILIQHFGSEDLSVSDSAITALMKIGTNAVVQAIADEWDEGSDDFRGAAADVLETIHTHMCFEKCLGFLADEEESETQLALGHAILSHFSFEGIEPVRQLVLGDEDELATDDFDVRYRLVAVATIMGIDFPELAAWHREALESNWGWGESKPHRLADAFRPDPVGPKRSGNGKH
jgi:hypothetical protein